MTPRERAIESLTLLRQNASKRNATYSQCFLDDMADVTEHAIIADRQALQSEMRQKIASYCPIHLRPAIAAGRIEA